MSTTQGDRAAREAGEVAAVVSCEVVVELGETNLWVSLDQDGTTSRPDLVEGAQPGQFPADLRVSAAGRWYWDTGHPLRDGDLLVSNVLARVDDPVPVIIGREAVSGAELVAWQVATVVRLTNADGPARLTLLHPVDLSRRGRAAVERHLSRQLPVGTQVVWVSRAAAAVAATPECVDLAPSDRVGVLHVGGSSVEAAVWRRTETAGDVVAVRADRSGAGHAVDDALLSAMSRGTGFGRPAGWSPVDLPGLRRECERAKVALSAETAVDVDVEGVPVRMVRGDVEELSAPLVTRQLDTLGAVLARSDEEGSPLRMILLVGGATAAPSLVEAAGARFDVPVVALPRLGDVFARRAPAAAPDLVGAGLPAADTQGARGTAPAPTPTPDDTSSAAVLARARHRWTPMVPLTAAATATAATAVAGSTTVTAVAGSEPRPTAPVSTKRRAAPRSNHASRPSPIPAAASARPETRLARIPVPRPTHLAVAAAVLIAIAAVPAIGGAITNADDPTTLAAPRPGSAAVAGAASGIFGGSGLAFTPGAAGSAGPSVSQWLSNPTGTLGPNQLLSMVRPAAVDASPGSTPSTPGDAPAAVAAGTAPAAAPAGGSTPAAGSKPAGAGSTPASTTPPASTPPASNPPASNPPASDPPVTNPPASDPPASDPPASDPPATDPPAPEPTNDPGPQSTPDPEPSNPDPVVEATLAGDGSGSGGGAEVGDGSDGSIAP